MTAHVRPIVRIQAEDFDTGAEIARLTGGRTDIGAVVSFSGLCRDEAGQLARWSSSTIREWPRPRSRGSPTRRCGAGR